MAQCKRDTSSGGLVHNVRLKTPFSFAVRHNFVQSPFNIIIIIAAAAAAAAAAAHLIKVINDCHSARHLLQVVNMLLCLKIANKLPCGCVIQTQQCTAAAPTTGV